MTTPDPENAAKIRALNDLFRTGERLDLGTVVANGDLAQADPDIQQAALTAVREFTAWTDGDDPYLEHDFGTFSLGAMTFIFKIDYYDPKMEFGARDPADPATCRRLLTIMFAHDY
jgi:hypothetical protein